MGRRTGRIPLAGQPLAEFDRIEPADRRHGLASGSVERETAECGEVRVGHLIAAQAEGRDTVTRWTGRSSSRPSSWPMRNSPPGIAHQIVWAHLPISRIAVCVRWRRRGPGRRAPCRRWKTRGACACRPPCGRSPDKCTHRRAACRWEPALRRRGPSVRRRGRTWSVLMISASKSSPTRSAMNLTFFHSTSSRSASAARRSDCEHSSASGFR